jgi:hypothetical protein
MPSRCGRRCSGRQMPSLQRDGHARRRFVTHRFAAALASRLLGAFPHHGAPLQQGFATWPCYRDRGCGTLSPRLTSSTTLCPLRASWREGSRGTPRAASLCNAAALLDCLCGGIRFRTSPSRAARRRDGCILIAVVHYRIWWSWTQLWSQSKLIWLSVKYLWKLSIRRTQVRASSGFTLAYQSRLRPPAPVHKLLVSLCSSACFYQPRLKYLQPLGSERASHAIVRPSSTTPSQVGPYHVPAYISAPRPRTR